MARLRHPAIENAEVLSSAFGWKIISESHRSGLWVPTGDDSVMNIEVSSAGCLMSVLEMAGLRFRVDHFTTGWHCYEVTIFVGGHPIAALGRCITDAVIAALVALRGDCDPRLAGLPGGLFLHGDCRSFAFSAAMDRAAAGLGLFPVTYDDGRCEN